MIIYENIKTAMDILVEYWGADGKRVIEVAQSEHKPMTMTHFLDHCVACGGNWGGMLLSGLKELYPQTWAVIPEDMGTHAWECICSAIILCGVDSDK